MSEVGMNETIFDVLAREIIAELGDDSLNEAQVSEWLKYNLQVLNLNILEDLTEEDLAEDLLAQAVFKAMYFCKYFNGLVRKALDGVITSSGESTILSIKDGTSSVTFQNKNEVSKSYKSLYDSSKTYLDNLINSYKMHKLMPYQIVQIPAIPPYLNFES